MSFRKTACSEGNRLKHTSRKSGFTLVELLVVITIIGILIALLLPAVQAAREAARRMQCSNNFKQVGLALHNYHSVKGCFPAGDYYYVYSTPSSTSFCFGWSTYLLPYMEQEGLYNNIDFGGQWGYATSTLKSGQGMSNLAVSATIIPGYLCPSALSHLDLWVDGLQFVAGVVYSHLPIDAALAGVDVG
jgi:prepilin-type N-terminal cleavage/methylation domain-containing protein